MRCSGFIVSFGNYQGAAFQKLEMERIDQGSQIPEAPSQKKKNQREKNVWERNKGKWEYVHQTNGQFVRFHLIHRHTSALIFGGTR